MKRKIKYVFASFGVNSLAMFGLISVGHATGINELYNAGLGFIGAELGLFALGIYALVREARRSQTKVTRTAIKLRKTSPEPANKEVLEDPAPSPLADVQPNLTSSQKTTLPSDPVTYTVTRRKPT